MEFCFQEGINALIIEPSIPVPRAPEIMAPKIWDSEKTGLLCRGCYCLPPLQGTSLFDILTENIDTIIMSSDREQVIIIGDMNQQIVREAFNTLLVVHDLYSFVISPTHRSNSSLEPVVTDLPPPLFNVHR